MPYQQEQGSTKKQNFMVRGVDSREWLSNDVNLSIDPCQGEKNCEEPVQGNRKLQWGNDWGGN